MALLQVSPLLCTSSLAFTFASNGSVRNGSVQSASVSRPLSICRASADSSNGAGVFINEECVQAPLMFKDESNGIVCYYNEKGELTCEGWDEGPHFQPEVSQYIPRRRRMTPRAMQMRGSGDTVRFKSVSGRMRETLREGVADESLNCSEL